MKIRSFWGRVSQYSEKTGAVLIGRGEETQTQAHREGNAKIQTKRVRMAR
jgi:hypothetical protein